MQIGGRSPLLCDGAAAQAQGNLAWFLRSAHAPVYGCVYVREAGGDFYKW